MKKLIFLISVLFFLYNPVLAVSTDMAVEKESVVIRDQSKGQPFVAKNKNKKVERTSDSPWQLKKIRKKARRNYRKGTPNPSKSNFTWWQRTRLYYKIKARKAKRNATYNKADAPRNKEFNRKRAIRRNSKSLPFYKKLKKRRK
jgi:hypothetical protein